MVAPVSTGDDAVAGAHRVTAEVLDLLRAWLADDRFAASRLAVVTRGAVAVRAGEDTEPAAAAVWGLVRTAQTEHPGRFLLVDTDGAPGRLRAVPSAGDEPRSALREGHLTVARLARLAGDALRPPAGAESWRVNVVPLQQHRRRRGRRRAGHHRPRRTGRGTRRRARGRPELPRRPVRARHVPGRGRGDELRGRGHRGRGRRRRDQPGRGRPRARHGARRFRTAGRDGPQARRTATRGLVVGPGGGAAVGVRQARYALADLAEVEPGDKVLVHAAAGGVGMAAVQLARYLGARSSRRRPVQVAACCAHRPARRTSRRRVRPTSPTGSRAMDVVLNSLAGGFVDASLELLAPGGRFVELGKTDIRNRRRPAAGHVLPRLRPDGGRPRPHPGLLTEWSSRYAWASGRVPSRRDGLETRVPPSGQRRHATPARSCSPSPRRGGTVLITGGTGVLGGLLARHLVPSTARVTWSWPVGGAGRPRRDRTRRGADRPGRDRAFERCDVADPSAVDALLAGIPDLTAVVHAAGALDDGVLTALTADRLPRCCAPRSTPPGTCTS